MRSMREVERREDRALGALRLIDGATGAAMVGRFDVSPLDGERVSLQRNRSGHIVIRSWQRLAAHAESFEAPPAAPAVGSQRLRLAVRDPQERYLSRVVAVDLPRDPDPTHRDDPDSLFQPVRVPVYCASSAATGANWSVLRVSLTETASGDALGGALLRVRRNGEVLGRGLSDWRGEALVPVVGVPVTTFSEDEDAVVVSAIDVTLEACFDPDHGLRTPMADVRAGRAPTLLPLVDPDSLESGIGGLPQASASLSIAARSSQHRALSLDLP